MNIDNDQEFIYTPKELNNKLLKYTKIIENEYKNIKLKGDVIECKLWRYGGMSFKLTNNNISFECKVWLSDGLNLEKIVELENKNCTVCGDISAEYYYGHKFILTVKNIYQNTEKSKLKSFKEECENKGFFKNKKNINWNEINNIGIISKSNTQGYNDFTKQIKIPININLEEIILEGKDTAKTCIKAINNLQQNDIIIIIRGGGTTSEISNSFDVTELFETIKKSKKPVITAIGHEYDKGDKLLITEVSDLNYPTPSTAAIEINKIKLLPKINKIHEIKSKIDELIMEYFEKEEDNCYNNLKMIYKNISNEKFGAPIIKINNNESFIIIEKDGNFYKNTINYNDPMNLSQNDIDIYKNIENSINYKDFDTFQENLNKITINNQEINTKLQKYIKDLQKIIKLQNNYENVKPKLLNTLYCKNFELSKLKIQKLIQLYAIYLYYLKILEENTDSNKIIDIYNYL